MGDEQSFTAEDYKDFIIHMFLKYQWILENVICLVGNIMSMNKLLATLCSVPLVGCAEQQFNR
jgi:hypothetical protein